MIYIFPGLPGLPKRLFATLLFASPQVLKQNICEVQLFIQHIKNWPYPAFSQLLLLPFLATIQHSVGSVRFCCNDAFVWGENCATPICSSNLELPGGQERMGGDWFQCTACKQCAPEVGSFPPSPDFQVQRGLFILAEASKTNVCNQKTFWVMHSFMDTTH